MDLLNSTYGRYLQNYGFLATDFCWWNPDFGIPQPRVFGSIPVCHREVRVCLTMGLVPNLMAGIIWYISHVFPLRYWKFENFEGVNSSFADAQRTNQRTQICWWSPLPKAGLMLLKANEKGKVGLWSQWRSVKEIATAWHLPCKHRTPGMNSQLLPGKFRVLQS